MVGCPTDRMRGSMSRRENIFHILSQDMYNIGSEGAALEDCFSGDPSLLKATPLRYRIIALGFARHMRAEEVNAKLIENGCPALYSRNMWEAALIFAFQNDMSYRQWRTFSDEIREITEQQGGSEWFSGSRITLRELEQYVTENSADGGDSLRTEMRTRYLDDSIARLGNDAESFRAFLRANVHSFSLSREKTRYYFCKYLYYYLTGRIEDYFEACRKKQGIGHALAEMSALKVITKLRRNLSMPEAEKRALIRDSVISCGELFDAFSYFFFGYVSLDWADVLLEGCDDPEQIEPSLRKALANKLRKGRPEWRGLSDTEVIEEKLRGENETDNTGNEYGKNRTGEWTLMKFIKGTLDIDRTVLLCFLLFFSTDTQLSPEHRITEARLQQILSACGYAQLDIENDFDWFVLEFLESRHPRQLVNDLVAESAERQENSFLYRVYCGAVNNNEQLKQTML